MTACEPVIRFGRPFSIRLPDGTYRENVREITVPFAESQSMLAASAALREVEVLVREVHDAGAEDYRAVVPGTVIRPSAEIEGAGGGRG